MTQQNWSMNSDFNAKLAALNLGVVFETLVNSKGWKRQRAVVAIARYKNLLSLVHQNPSQVIVPEEEMDLVLHCHIETGAKFVEDSHRLFGCDLHHETVFGTRGEADQQAWLKAFHRTQKLFEKAFGRGAMGTSNSPAYCFIIADNKSIQFS